MTLFIPLATDRPLAPEHVQARLRQAFAYAGRTKAIEGLPPPELGPQIPERIGEAPN